MDKINIKFNDSKFDYEIRIPNGFNWFEIKRYNNYSDKNYDVVNLVNNNGNFIVYSYGISKRKKITHYITDEEKETIIKTILINIVNYIGFNSLTAVLISKFGYDVNYLMKKLKEKNCLYYDNEYNVIERIEEKIIGGVECRESILSLLDYNCEYVATIRFINDSLYVEIKPNNPINVMKVINSYINEKDNPITKTLLYENNTF